MIMRRSSSPSSSFSSPLTSTRGRIHQVRNMRPLLNVFCILVIIGQMQIQTFDCLQIAQTQQDLSQVNRASAIPNNEAQRRQQHQQTGSNQGQATGGGGFNGEFSSSSGLTDGNMMMNLAGPYLNSKRARKMSAFMPMRGRKDGRDYSPGSWPMMDSVISYLPVRETDETDASILRLASLVANQALAANTMATPRSFVEKMAARRAQQQQLQLQQPSGEVGGEVAFEPATNNLILEGPQSTVMQAKLRRAFHPMRGKKFDPELLASAGTDDQFGDLPSDLDQM